MTRPELSAVVAKLENDKAIISTDNGQRLDWPLELLPEGLAEGDKVILQLNKPGILSEDKDQLAKNILGEILNTNA